MIMGKSQEDPKLPWRQLFILCVLCALVLHRSDIVLTQGQLFVGLPSQVYNIASILHNYAHSDNSCTYLRLSVSSTLFVDLRRSLN